jgi:choline kinase
MKLIILAAGKSSRIFKSIKTHKCLLKINNKTLIKRIVDMAINSKNVNNILIIVGFLKDKIFKEIKSKKVNFFYNDKYQSTDMLYSLYCGIKDTNEDVIISYSDIFYDEKIFQKLTSIKSKNIMLPIYTHWKKIWKFRNKDILTDCETLKFDKDFFLKEIGNPLKNINQPMGQFMGLLFIPKIKLKIFKRELFHSLKKNIQTTAFLNIIIKHGIKIKVIPHAGTWYEFDDETDYNNFFKIKKFLP